MSKKKIKVSQITTEQLARVYGVPAQSLIQFTTGQSLSFGPIVATAKFYPYPNVEFSPMIEAIRDLEKALHEKEQMISYKFHYHVLGYFEDAKPTE